MSKLEASVFGGILLGWAQLMCGYTAHAFYSLGIIMTITLMGIMGYLREIYLRPK